MRSLRFSLCVVSLPLLCAFGPAPEHGFRSEVSFSEAERALHLETLPRILEVAKECMETDLARQREFYAKHKVSAFYGDQSEFGKSSRSSKRDWLRELGKNPALVDEMESTSCVGFAMKCLGKGFRAAGQGRIFEKINAYGIANESSGLSIQEALRKLGWKTLFWNPDPTKNAAWDEWEQDHYDQETGFWGWHAYRSATVKRDGIYYLVGVDDATTLVGFGKDVPASFRKLPYFLGVAHAGYHVFPGAFGQVIEAHSTRAITDARTVEGGPFNPLESGGAPAGRYRSGLIAVPPGYGF